MAEGILRKLADERNLDWQIDSAGTNGIHTGEPPHKSSQKVCKQNGIDITAQRAIDFRKEFVQEYDRIYVFAYDVMQDVKNIAGNDFDEKKVDYFLNELYPGKNLDVTDPWYGGEEGYYAVYEEIYKGCEAIMHRYGGKVV